MIITLKSSLLSNAQLMRISTPCTTSSKAPSTEMKIRILEEIQGVKNVYEILLKVALNTINPKKL
jgi:hypothetical protein